MRLPIWIWMGARLRATVPLRGSSITRMRRVLVAAAWCRARLRRRYSGLMATSPSPACNTPHIYISRQPKLVMSCMCVKFCLLNRLLWLVMPLSGYLHPSSFNIDTPWLQSDACTVVTMACNTLCLSQLVLRQALRWKAGTRLECCVGYLPEAIRHTSMVAGSLTCMQILRSKLLITHSQARGLGGFQAERACKSSHPAARRTAQL